MTDKLPIDDIHDLAANYSDRQGLRIVPMALAVMIQGFSQIPSFIFGIDTMLVCLAVGLGGYYLIGRYYEHRFGQVEELPYAGIPLSLQLLLIGICIPIALAIDVGAHPPVFVSGLLIATWLIVTAWPSRRIRGEYLSIGLVLVLFSFSPLVGLPMADVARAYGFWFGAMLLMAAVRDHIAFMRFFPTLEGQRE
jgi:hypothetical protein